MTLEQKNFIFGFLKISKVNKDFEEFEEEIKESVSFIVEKLPHEERKKWLELEDKFYKYIDLVKSYYFDFGVSAEQTLRDINLSYNPQLKKGVRENDN